MLRDSDLWIPGRSWTYQLRPPKLQVDDPLLVPLAGEIIGKVRLFTQWRASLLIVSQPISELQEWHKFETEEAFSPVQSAVPLPPTFRETTIPSLPGVLSSPFDSHRGRKRKIHDHHNPSPNHASIIPLSTPARRQCPPLPESPYVFVNDLPPWEWFLPTASEIGGSQSQGARESLRSADGKTVRRDDGAVPGTRLSKGQGGDAEESVRCAGHESTIRRQDAQIAVPTVSTPNSGSARPGAQISPEVGFTSFLTDASVDLAPPTPTAHEDTAIPGQRPMRRMPVLLKDLDHTKFPPEPAPKSRSKVPTALEKEVKRREERAAGRDKRVRELQAGLQGKGKLVRPIKEFLPLPMRVEPQADVRAGQGFPVLNLGSKPNQNRGEDSVVEEISFADSVHTEGGTVREVPCILVDGMAVVSPVKGTIEKRGRNAERNVSSDLMTRGVSDRERWGVVCAIIPQVGTLTLIQDDADGD